MHRGTVRCRINVNSDTDCKVESPSPCSVASELVKPGELAPPVNVKTKLRVSVMNFFSADFSEKTDDGREKKQTPVYSMKPLTVFTAARGHPQSRLYGNEAERTLRAQTAKQERDISTYVLC